MKSILILCVLCLVKGIYNVPVPATITTAQKYLDQAREYIKNTSPGTVQVPTVSPSMGNTVIVNPPRLPTVQTTTAKATTTTTTTTTTTKMPTTTARAPVTTTKAPETTTKAFETTTEAPVPTTKQMETTTEPETTTKPSAAPETTFMVPETTQAPETTTKTSDPNKPVIVISVYFRELVTKFIILLNEIILRTNSEEIRVLAETLKNTLINEFDITGTDNQQQDVTDSETDVTIDTGNPSSSNNADDNDDDSINEQLFALLVELIALLSEPMTDANKERISEVMIKFTNVVEGEGSTSTTDTTTESPTTTEGGPTTTEGGSTTTTTYTDQLNLLILQLIALMDTNASREQIYIILQFISRLIDNAVENGSSNGSTNTSGNEGSTQNEINAAIREQIKNLIAQIMELLDQSNTSVTQQQIQELLGQLIITLTKRDEATVQPSIEGSPGGNESEDSNDDIEDDSQVSEGDTTGQSTDGNSTNSSTDDAGSSRNEDANSIRAQIILLLAELENLIKLNIDEATKQLFTNLINALKDIANAIGDSSGGANSLPVTTTDTISERMKELIAQIINLISQPDILTNMDRFDQLLKDLINELKSGKSDDTDTTTGNTDDQGIPSAPATSTLPALTTTNVPNQTTPRDRIGLIIVQLIRVINQPATVARKRLITELIDQLESELTTTTIDDSIKQLMSDIKKLLSRPISTRNSQKLDELVRELIRKLSGSTSVQEVEETNSIGINLSDYFKLRNKQLFDSIMKRRAERLARRKEIQDAIEKRQAERLARQKKIQDAIEKRREDLKARRKEIQDALEKQRAQQLTRRKEIQNALIKSREEMRARLEKAASDRQKAREILNKETKIVLQSTNTNTEGVESNLAKFNQLINGLVSSLIPFASG